MFSKISFKVTFFVNLVLFVVIGLGTVVLAQKQFANLDAQYKAQAKFDSMVAAKAVSRILEEAIDSGVVSAAHAFDTEYQAYGTFDPPKYHTKYDAYTDKSLLSLQDEMLKNPNIVFAVTVDNNGYLPTHNSKYQQPITGDKQKDKVGNRTKRIFNDPTGLAAAKNTEPGFIQIYKRDTGETMWDVSNPILVKGKQWGNFRIGLSIATLQKAKANLLTHLILIMSALLILSTLLINYTVKSALAPLTVLTQKASRMADGEVNEQIFVHTKDEIGQLAEALERMRVSLRSAMERLMKR